MSFVDQRNDVENAADMRWSLCYNADMVCPRNFIVQQNFFSNFIFQCSTTFFIV